MDVDSRDKLINANRMRPHIGELKFPPCAFDDILQDSARLLCDQRLVRFRQGRKVRKNR